MTKLEKVTGAAKAHTSGSGRTAPHTTCFPSVYASPGSSYWQGPFQRSAPGLDVLFPDGFRDWFFVNSLTAPAESPLFGHVGGLHHIYVNGKGL